MGGLPLFGCAAVIQRVFPSFSKTSGTEGGRLAECRGHSIRGRWGRWNDGSTLHVPIGPRSSSFGFTRGAGWHTNPRNVRNFARNLPPGGKFSCALFGRGHFDDWCSFVLWCEVRQLWCM